MPDLNRYLSANPVCILIEQFKNAEYCMVSTSLQNLHY